MATQINYKKWQNWIAVGALAVSLCTLWHSCSSSKRADSVAASAMEKADDALSILRQDSNRSKRQEERASREEELFRVRVVHDSSNIMRDLIIEADTIMCGQGYADPALDFYLDEAVQVAERIAKNDGHVPTSQYLSMAGMAFHSQGFTDFNTLCEKALENSRSDLDRHKCLTLLGHFHFRQFEDEPTEALLRKARDYMAESAKAIEPMDSSARVRFLLGRLYSLWAAHEAYFQFEGRSQEYFNQVEIFWKDDPNRKELIEGAEVILKDAKNGIPPAAPCPKYLSRRILVVPGPAPTPVDPLPLPVLPGGIDSRSSTEPSRQVSVLRRT